MRKLLKTQGFAPTEIVTDRVGSYGAAFRALGVSAQHIQGKRKNNRAERRMQGFRSPGAAQRFLSTYAAAYNTFNFCRHLVSAKTHRRLRSEAIIVWRCAASVTA
jgi:putative transposase